MASRRSNRMEPIAKSGRRRSAPSPTASRHAPHGVGNGHQTRTGRPLSGSVCAAPTAAMLCAECSADCMAITDAASIRASGFSRRTSAAPWPFWSTVARPRFTPPANPRFAPESTYRAPCCSAIRRASASDELSITVTGSSSPSASRQSESWSGEPYATTITWGGATGSAATSPPTTVSYIERCSSATLAQVKSSACWSPRARSSVQVEATRACLIPSARAAGSAGSTRMPAVATTSGMAPDALATTGTPAAIASTATRQNCSRQPGHGSDGTATTSSAWYRATNSAPLACPRNSTRRSIPS